ncbi:MAG TPA: hypothetical protein VI796_00130 [Candidatus Thermoplasmatota archaeon]|nr:hypothetical protein [Candidatus Thermoplasmatota archaeon]
MSEPSGVWVNEALEPEAPPEASTPLPDESLPEAYGAGAPTAPATAFSGPPAPSFRLPGILLVAGGFLLWRAVAFAAPLFSRLKGQQAREQEVRAAMLRLVRRNPGIHAAEMSRCLGLNESHTRYHLGVLERFNLVRKERVHKYACYFPVSGAAAHPDGRMVAILKAGRARRVLAFAAANPGGAVSTLERQEGLPRGAFDYHLRRLAAANLLEVRRDGARRRLFLNATMGTAGPRSGQILATSRVPSEGSPGNPLKIQENPA